MARSKTWRFVSTATLGSDWTYVAETEAANSEKSAVFPNQCASLEPAEPQPHRNLAVGTIVRRKSQTRRVVYFGTTPVSMYCAPDEAMYSTSGYPDGNAAADAVMALSAARASVKCKVESGK